MFKLLCAWAFWFANYLVLAGQVSVTEAGAGALCAAAAVLWAAGVRRASPRNFVFDTECWPVVARACRKLPGATLSVAVALLRAALRGKSRGAVQASFFAHGPVVDPRNSGRRAVGVLAASLAPNSFVLRTAAGRDEVVIHALPAGTPPADPRWPI